GDIQADETIEILVPGKVAGDIQAPNVVIHKGAILRGNCLTKAPDPAPGRGDDSASKPKAAGVLEPIPLNRVRSGKK
ncbi:MAG: polymer-forming cytoskeletal protein, partial [Desulfobacterales bacterium]|nr:polymer-forming cytoskeletal protein [Desulfobacterales bacterium]